ncbi:hypothetical protein A3A93_01685 [Candidatus Roizmanbacteria bacterium RIFCSPLOWO2_01_FULL_38_12]|uniref:Uncharacterized protein n=1 Tax=Candidatus Roizmanbacteria bacterium RIFCSPLOWO2_01_FULL_38_12 TaxID=1802061 RepID=A0A1F7IY89_9BACT|nr:MAG: hypothetical protein A2861_02320 [Candidatus Roizmanbacteria bacterium RIFCSPHIGHO2_01_FULL_38_15]OGK34501.1 MAG: hypothetical protein A3F59_04210 [Candidatus Roizmanbacteria bacterium RIFCSPHIGHO2_12_FULL_38_13]OGK48330.1 MAG: hypothetical protein A3A93_01685 [Candidatus Roizmanbacteria bacterium RIFCSPLOWO2_01_FULL_38_12]
MKNKHFYTDIVEVDSIFVALDKMDLTSEELSQLKEMVESQVHQVVIDTVLSQLSEKDQKFFLMHLAHGRHDEILQHLKKNIEKVEEKIIKAVDELKNDLHADIKESRQKK